MAMNRPDPTPEVLERAEAGYSLVSVLIALLLLAVGVIALSSVLTQSISMQTVMSTRTSALYIAQAHMEELKGRDPITLTAESAVNVNEDGQVDVNGVFTRSVSVDSAGRNLMQVVVSVTTPRSNNPIQLVTWVYDRRY